MPDPMMILEPESIEGDSAGRVGAAGDAVVSLVVGAIEVLRVRAEAELVACDLVIWSAHCSYCYTRKELTVIAKGLTQEELERDGERA